MPTRYICPKCHKSYLVNKGGIEIAYSSEHFPISRACEQCREKCTVMEWKKCSFLEYDSPAGNFCWHPNRVDACLEDECPMPPVVVDITFSKGGRLR